MTSTTTTHVTTGTLKPQPPYDFAKTLAFLRAFTPTAGEQALDGETITKAVTLNGRAVAFTLRDAGTEEAPRLAYMLHAESPLRADEEEEMADRIGFFLSLHDDLRPFYALGQVDPAFAPVIARFYGLHQPKFLTPFEIACWAILGQRVPMPIAHRAKMALVERFGTRITVDGETYHAFPEPAQLAAVDPAALAEVVRNARKVEYLQAVAQLFTEVDEGWLRTGDYEEVAARLRAVRGIGNWSLHFILVRGLGRMERVSAVDAELAKAAARLYNGGQPLAPVELQRILDRYGPMQGYWAYYARIATMDRMAAM